MLYELSLEVNMQGICCRLGSHIANDYQSPKVPTPRKTRRLVAQQSRRVIQPKEEGGALLRG